MALRLSGYPAAMAINKQSDPQNTNPEADQATPEAQAMHGEKARVEKHEQPQAIALDGDTLIAEPDAGDSTR